MHADIATIKDKQRTKINHDLKRTLSILQFFGKKKKPCSPFLEPTLLYELKHKIRLSKTVCGIFHF